MFAESLKVTKYGCSLLFLVLLYCFGLGFGTAFFSSFFCFATKASAFFFRLLLFYGLPAHGVLPLGP